MSSVGSWSVALLLGLSALGAMGCTPGGVGDPCTPEDEYQQTFSGFQQTEVNVESRSFQCTTRICLVNHFQGRVSCKLGQEAPPIDPTTHKTEAGYAPACSIPGTRTSRDGTDPNNVNVKVPPQLVARQTDKAVYCSCRCNGPDKNARYCECPDGFECAELVKDLKIPGATGGNLAGSYCIRSGSAYASKADTPQTECSRMNPESCGCGGNNPDPYCGALPPM